MIYNRLTFLRPCRRLDVDTIEEFLLLLLRPDEYTEEDGGTRSVFLFLVGLKSFLNNPIADSTYLLRSVNSLNVVRDYHHFLNDRSS